MIGILGGGISGLSAAHYVLKNPKLGSPVVLEASNRVGGWIRSIKQDDGTIFEKGPRVIRANLHNTLDLVEELELSSKVIPIRITHPAANRRYIYADNTLHIVPFTMKGFFTRNTLLNRSFVSLIWNDLRTRKVLKDDESIYSFIRRRFGTDVSEKLIAPIVCGICGGDIHNISARSMMKRLFEAEQTHGSVFGGLLKQKLLERKNSSKSQSNSNSQTPEQLHNTHSHLAQRAKQEAWIMWGLEGGFEQLPQALAQNIVKHGGAIRKENNCEKIIFGKDGVQLIVNGNIQKYTYVISSLPAKSLANLVDEQHPELSKELRSIPSVTIAIVNLQYCNTELPMKAFGFLIPPKEEIPILGTIFDSHILPQNSKMTVLTVMMGGAWFEKYFGKCSSEEHLKSVAKNYVKQILCIDEDPSACNVSILKDCIPQHIIGHTQRLTRIRNYIATHKIPLGLSGSSYDAVGVSDVILSAKEAVSNINQCM